MQYIDSPSVRDYKGMIILFVVYFKSHAIALKIWCSDDTAVLKYPFVLIYRSQLYSIPAIPYLFSTSGTSWVICLSAQTIHDCDPNIDHLELWDDLQIK